MALPEILVLTTYPPRECGIATYTHDLIEAIHAKYAPNFTIKICALENTHDTYKYPIKPAYRLLTDQKKSYHALSSALAQSPQIKLVLIQHEFGLFEAEKEAFGEFIQQTNQAVIFVFHTVLPRPNPSLQASVMSYAQHAAALIVMTQSSSQILEDYNIDADKIHIIPHGTHLIAHTNKTQLKEQYDLQDRIILSTFGFIGSNKSIETSLYALPAIIEKYPNVLFLIIGKTHPNTLKNDGEKYRDSLSRIIQEKGLQKHTQWINSFLPTSALLDLLSLTDVYLFTSNDPNQAVSGTFSYAIGSGCPIVSTCIPQVSEVLSENMGIIIDFNQPKQLADAVIHLLDDEPKRQQMRINSLQKMAISAWENSAIHHGNLFAKTCPGKFDLRFKWPQINLSHVRKMTTDFGILQFAKVNEPDLQSGYTLDDNARALIALVNQYIDSPNLQDLQAVHVYLNFIEFCQQTNGSFLNYVDQEQQFTDQNASSNLEDSIGRTLWALGYVISKQTKLPEPIITQAKSIFQRAIVSTEDIHSTRAMAFIMKGIFYTKGYTEQMSQFANRLAGMYKHESSPDWAWFENKMTYANSVLPEAMLMASITLTHPNYQRIAIQSLDFLIQHTFGSDGIHVISNAYWRNDGERPYQFGTEAFEQHGGEQAIDVCYTLLALQTFHSLFQDAQYLTKMHIAFDWFLGQNHLNQIIYNPSTGGCYDGLELANINLNQGAESTLSYLLARQAMDSVTKPKNKAESKQKLMA
jgi:glycosyltransferase involved in cell wall biosynthesis